VTQAVTAVWLAMSWTPSNSKATLNDILKGVQSAGEYWAKSKQNTDPCEITSSFYLEYPESVEIL
jgi:hypothetical protein